MQTAVRKLGNSAGVIIPKSVLAELGLTAGDAVDLRMEDGRIILAPVRRPTRAGWPRGLPHHRPSSATTPWWLEPAAGRGRPGVVTRPEAVARGAVWLAALDPTIGSEIQKTRPCVIVSPPEMHDHLRTVTVAPMTTGSRPAPYRIPIRFQARHGLILLDQLRTLDKQRLVRRLGSVSARTLSVTLAALREMFEE